MNILSLFPTPVGIYELERQLTELERKFIDKQKISSNIGNSRSEDSYILENKNLLTLKVFFSNCLDKFFKHIYSPSADIKLRITQSWLNYTAENEFHHSHAHPNSFISGVFYIQTTNGSDRIYFQNDVYNQIEIKPVEYNIYNSKSWWIDAIEGQLILFPSNLVHRVNNLPSGSKTRISLSFNTFPVGQLGSTHELTEAILT